MKETDNLLRENSHDRDISEIVATITALDHPSPSLLRFTAFVPGSANNPVWAEANVAIRLYLSEEFDDATRVYTVRSFDAATESIVVDVVQHHHESPMMRWSDTVKINDTLVLTGPRPHFVIPEANKQHSSLMTPPSPLSPLFWINGQQIFVAKDGLSLTIPQPSMNYPASTDWN